MLSQRQRDLGLVERVFAVLNTPLQKLLDTKGTTQKIIIGYLGPHLRNTKTN